MPDIDKKAAASEKLTVSLNPTEMVDAEIVAAVLQQVKDRELNKDGTKHRYQYAGLISAQPDGTLREPLPTKGESDEEAAENADELAKHPSEAVSLQDTLVAFKAKLDAEAPRSTQPLTLDYVLHVNDNHFTRLKIEISANQETIKVIQIDSSLEAGKIAEFNKTLQKNINTAITAVFTKAKPTFEKKAAVAKQFGKTCPDWTALAILDDYKKTNEIAAFHNTKGNQSEEEAKAMRAKFVELAKGSALKDKIDSVESSKKTKEEKAKLKPTATVDTVTHKALGELDEAQQKEIILKAMASDKLEKIAEAIKSVRKYKKFELTANKNQSDTENRIDFSDDKKTCTIYLTAVATIAASNVPGQPKTEEKIEKVDIVLSCSVKAGDIEQWHCSANNNKIIGWEESCLLIAEQCYERRAAREVELKSAGFDVRAITVKPIVRDAKDLATKKIRTVASVEGEFTDDEEILINALLTKGFLHVEYGGQSFGPGLTAAVGVTSAAVKDAKVLMPPEAIKGLEEAKTKVIEATKAVEAAKDKSEIDAVDIDAAITAANAAEKEVKRTEKNITETSGGEMPAALTAASIALKQKLAELEKTKKDKLEKINQAENVFDTTKESVKAATVALDKAKNADEVTALSVSPDGLIAKVTVEIVNAKKSIQNLLGSEIAAKSHHDSLDKLQAGLKAAAESKLLKINAANAAVLIAEKDITVATADAINALDNAPAVETYLKNIEDKVKAATEAYEKLDEAAKGELKERVDALSVNVNAIKTNGNARTAALEKAAADKAAAILNVKTLLATATAAVGLVEPAIKNAVDQAEIKQLSSEDIPTPETALISKATIALKEAKSAIVSAGEDEATKLLSTKCNELEAQFAALKDKADLKIKAIDNVDALFKAAKKVIAAANEGIIDAENSNAVTLLSFEVMADAAIPDTALIKKAEVAVEEAEKAIADIEGDSAKEMYQTYMTENFVLDLKKLRTNATAKIGLIGEVEAALEKVDTAIASAENDISKAESSDAAQACLSAVNEAAEIAHEKISKFENPLDAAKIALKSEIDAKKGNLESLEKSVKEKIDSFEEDAKNKINLISEKSDTILNEMENLVADSSSIATIVSDVKAKMSKIVDDGLSVIRQDIAFANDTFEKLNEAQKAELQSEKDGILFVPEKIRGAQEKIFHAIDALQTTYFAIIDVKFQNNAINSVEDAQEFLKKLDALETKEIKTATLAVQACKSDALNVKLNEINALYTNKCNEFKSKVKQKLFHLQVKELAAKLNSLSANDISTKNSKKRAETAIDNAKNVISAVVVKNNFSERDVRQVENAVLMASNIVRLNKKYSDLFQEYKELNLSSGDVEGKYKIVAEEYGESAEAVRRFLVLLDSEETPANSESFREANALIMNMRDALTAVQDAVKNQVAASSIPISSVVTSRTQTPVKIESMNVENEESKPPIRRK